MGVLARRAAIVALVAAAAAVAAPAAASAEPAAERTFAVSGDPGEHLTGGSSHRYSAADGDGVHAALDGPGHLTVRVAAVGGDEWRLDLAAPAGQPLAPGSHPAATWPADAGAPGLGLTGNGRDCPGVAGSFTIDDLVVDGGRVVALDAGFEVRCGGAAEAARGRVRIAGPPVGPLELGVATTGGVIDGGSGHALVEGTATCTEPVLVRVSGDAVQPAAGPAFGLFDTYVECEPGAPVEWDAVLPHLGDAPFEPGELTVSTRVSAVVPGDGSRVEVEQRDAVVVGFALVG